MRIGPKLLLNALLIAGFSVLVTVVLIGAMSYHYGKNILEGDAKDRLTLVRDNKADEVKRYFEGIIKQAIIFSNNATVVAAMRDLDQTYYNYAKEVSVKGMDKYKDEVIQHYVSEFSRDYAEDNGGLAFDATPYLNLSNHTSFALQYNYIFNNPNGIDKESKLEYVDDGSNYSKFHAKYHEHLRQLKELFGFEDIFLVDAETGDIIYTVAKGLDFTTSLKNGPYANSALAKVFRQANSNDGKKVTAISDFEPYSPSNDDQACFIATTIFDEGKKVGVLIFQIDSTQLNQIMTSDNQWESIGLGKTGETYVVDNQGRMITNSRFFVENSEGYLSKMRDMVAEPDALVRMKAKNNTIGWQKVDTFAAQQALEGKAGFGVYKDYRGVEVLGSYEPINIGGMTWAVVSEMDTSEAFAPINALAQKFIINLVGIMLLITLFSTVVGIGLAKQISVPIENLSAEITLLTKTQDLTRRIESDSNDEIGDMAKSINSLIETLQQTFQETINSTEKVQLTAHKLMILADEIDSRESGHKFEDNFDQVHEKTEAIKEVGDNLTELSSRLQLLSKQFKVFEQESDRVSGW